MDEEIKNVDWEKKETSTVKLIIVTCISFSILLVSFIALFCFFSSCTLSFQNISTHGTTKDLVNEDLTTSPRTNATIPLNLSSISKT